MNVVRSSYQLNSAASCLPQIPSCYAAKPSKPLVSL